MSTNALSAVIGLRAVPGYSLPDPTSPTNKAALAQQETYVYLPELSDDEVSSNGDSHDEISDHESSEDESCQDEKRIDYDDDDDVVMGGCGPEDLSLYTEAADEQLIDHNRAMAVTLPDPEWKRHGMTASREPNERYHGGSKDSLFAERYGRPTMGPGGYGDDDDDEEGQGSAGAGGGGGGGDGGGRGGDGGGERAVESREQKRELGRGGARKKTRAEFKQALIQEEKKVNKLWSELSAYKLVLPQSHKSLRALRIHRRRVWRERIKRREDIKGLQGTLRGYEQEAALMQSWLVSNAAMLPRRLLSCLRTSMTMSRHGGAEARYNPPGTNRGGSEA